jgi:hypothetical protein
VHLADYMTCLFSIEGLNSLAYSGGRLCAGVNLFMELVTCNMGFYHRWLVSLTRGKTFENEHAKQSAV